MPQHENPHYNITQYSRYMRNLAVLDLEKNCEEEVMRLIDVKAQENLINFMIQVRNNKLT